MTLLIRRILYITFITLFLVITPLLILYASGYKIKIGNGIKLNLSLQKTGMLILDSTPRGARVYLNNKPQQLFLKKYYSKEESFITTPAKIKNLLPGEYNIRLELPGYWNWEKKLTVRGGASTYAEDVYLFKNNLPLFVSAGTPIATAFSPDKNNLLFIGENNAVFLRLSDEEKTELNLDDEVDKILWSPSSEKILINNKVYELDRLGEPVDLNPYLDYKNQNLSWSAEDDNIIYYNPKNVINAFDLEAKTAKNIINSDEEIVDFLEKEGKIFYVSKKNEKRKFNVLDLNAGKVTVSLDLPSSAAYNFINAEHKLINLFDPRRETLYLINPSSYFPLEETVNNVKNGLWINENKLLYWNDFEIWLHDIDAKQKTLLTRISSSIQKAFWHPSNNYIIYATGDSFNILELDDREKRNSTELIKLDKIYFPFLSKEGDVLYFYAKIGNQEGLFKLAIQ